MPNDAICANGQNFSWQNTKWLDRKYKMCTEKSFVSLEQTSSKINVSLKSCQADTGIKNKAPALISLVAPSFSNWNPYDIMPLPRQGDCSPTVELLFGLHVKSTSRWLNKFNSPDSENNKQTIMTFCHWLSGRIVVIFFTNYSRLYKNSRYV